jgi:hypothetical protein
MLNVEWRNYWAEFRKIEAIIDVTMLNAKDAK